VALWGVVAILIMNTNCTPSHMLLASKENSCSSLDIRISVAMAISSAIEIAVLGACWNVPRTDASGKEGEEMGCYGLSAACAVSPVPTSSTSLFGNKC
jgi:hypothetical protein